MKKKTKMENLINDDLEKSFMMNLIMILMIKVNVIIRQTMMNLMNNLLKAKTVF